MIGFMELNTNVLPPPLIILPRVFFRSSEISLMAKSVWNGAICSRIISRCLIRKSCPSICVCGQVKACCYIHTAGCQHKKGHLLTIQTTESIKKHRLGDKEMCLINNCWLTIARKGISQWQIRELKSCITQLETKRLENYILNVGWEQILRLMLPF